MSNGAQQASGPATYRTLCELGSRAQRAFAAVREPDELLVAQRFVRVQAVGDPAPRASEGATPLDAEAMALLLRDARCLAKNAHPNIARVLHAEVSPAPRRELTIATELLEGSTLADLMRSAKLARTRARGPVLAEALLPERELVRIMLDVLAGLHALQSLRDAMDLPLRAIHGALCPTNVVVGRDGVTRIINVLRPRPVRVEPRSEAAAHASPEARGAEGTSDARADVYAVGAILREALAGTAPPRFPRLADAATRALSSDPDLRFTDPAAMVAELEAIARTDVATSAEVAALVVELAGAQIRRRRATLAPATSGTRRRVSVTPIDDVPAAEDDLPGPRASAPSFDDAAFSGAGRRVVTHARGSINPLAPMAVPGPTPALAPAVPTPPPRAPSVPTFPATGTPGDFVIPIDVTDTPSEAAPRRRKLRWAALAFAAAIVTIGTYVAVRTPSLAPRDPAPTAAAPLPADPLPAATPRADRPPATHEAPAIATTPVARASASASVRRALPPAPPAAAKPKRSVYEPDSL
jgi:serine/threonine-protein kinase